MGIVTYAINNITGNNTDKKETENKNVFRYRCTETCTYQGKFRREGEVIFLSENKKIEHFELIKDKEG